MIIESDLFIKLISWFMKPTAITLWPFIIISPTRLTELAKAKHRDRKNLEIELLRHEYIHYKQQKELFLIGFYVLYIYYFLKQYLKYKNTYIAYHKIPFEVEAHLYQDSIFYILEREKYAWRKYVS